MLVATVNRDEQSDWKWQLMRLKPSGYCRCIIVHPPSTAILEKGE